MSENFVVKLIQDIAVSEHKLTRTPEPTQVMDEHSSVHDFNETMRTNVTVNYAAAMDYLFRARNEIPKNGSRLLDLCSGPGNFSLCLVQHLGYETGLGIDLSAPMVKNAIANRDRLNLQKSLTFQHGDAMKLEPSKLGQFDAVTFANSAHHFNSIAEVRSLLEFAEKVCSAKGTILLSDLCRLPNQDVTNRFVGMVGQDYLDCGLPAPAEDFRASMQAAWSPAEMSGVAPRQTNRIWYHVIAAGLPYFQAVIGLPEGREELFVRPSKDWMKTDLFRTERAKQDWAMTSAGYYAGSIQMIGRPTKAAPRAA